ncbi:hypothetical protein D8674_024661 [Pyrus ussuriensis x Pyrus communis]|uniref:Uncharacterized protein n=1 Tax=Pyrus ussuriensis x Pyrus communis TaxID=2448454 RepID=A0A5N5H3J8_9ROSA|nr:hypothetical protein D8674_024661 [Pyrus ussuriensis x Pyrus communis]
MSFSSHKSDDGVPPLYCQGGSLSKTGYFKVAHFKISSDDSFREFLEIYRHAIPSGVRVKRVKESNSHLECGSTPKTSLDMKKVHIALVIPSEYHKWLWLLNHLCPEKGGLSSREEIKRIKAEVLARLITIVKPATHEGGKKRSSLPTQEMLAEKKPKTFSAAREGSPTAPMLEATKFVLVTLAIPKVASSIADRIAQRRRVKSSSHSERLATIKSDKVEFSAKVATKPFPNVAVTNLPAEKKETARASSYEKRLLRSIRLKPDLLKDIDACAKFVDGIKRKTTILAAKSMFLDQDDTKAAKKLAKTVATEAYSSAEKVKKLDFELHALKGSNISAPTSLQLETAHQKILRSATYAKDEELITAYNDPLQEADLYKLGYVDHLFGWLSDFEFSGKDFKTFSISSKDLLTFTFEASIGEVVGEIVGVPLLLDLFVVHGCEGVVTLAAYFADLVRTFPDGIHLFGTFSSGSDEVENHLVGCLSLPISLRGPWRGHVLLDAIFLEELRQIFAYELQAIICDDGLKDVESVNDGPPYKVLYVRLSHGCHRLCFYPFGEVINCHDHHASAATNERHWPYQVDYPLHELPMTRLWV